MKLEGVSLKQASVDVTKIDNYVKDTVNKVKQHYQLRPESLQPVGHKELYPGKRKTGRTLLSLNLPCAFLL